MSSTNKVLLEKIHQEIPLSKAMGFNIIELSGTRILVEGPLDENINIHGTAFAGSIYSLAVLSAWALVTHVLTEQGVDADLVIARAEIKYRAPVKDTIICFCHLDEAVIQRFLDQLSNKKYARIEARVSVGIPEAAYLNITLFANLRR